MYDKYIGIKDEDRNRVVELLERDDIDFEITNPYKMIELENNFHKSEDNKFILNECRVFFNGDLLLSDLNVLNVSKDDILSYTDDQCLDDVWEFKQWKYIDKK